MDYKLRADYSVFDFSLTDHMSDLVGRLMISPRRTQSYVRLAENLDPEIVELSSISMFDPLPPAWREWCMTGPELRVISPNQEARLREWRGIYLIVDETDGARYVGSAYGAENLLSRWRSHVRRDHGVTVQLQQRNPANFRFSILERVSPDTPIEEITALEQTWMHRLHTKRFGLNT
ncbi:GIY-YIG nuclease family protein [Vannielia litorea]|uniref:GIY-YIG nuclease family protein n=1 Tax=Vannielia litorea TaxID=1217970 RepID=UPI001C982DD1|nr:GIY-YIG nuclease family protein [Vannielia litorea]MBY6073483.1 GIY-YIG nuclease family protein [Vannielia litorea]